MYGSTKRQVEDIALVKKGDSIINMGPFDAPENETDQERFERLERIKEFMENPFSDKKDNPEFWETVSEYYACLLYIVCCTLLCMLWCDLRTFANREPFEKCIQICYGHIALTLLG